MRNITAFLYIGLIFIFSCNTEAKFGFLKKVKVENHSIAKTIAKFHVTKPDEKKVDVDTCEIITANIANEKIILPQAQQHNFSVSPSISSKKILFDSTNHKIKIAEPKLEKELNIPAFIGLILGMIDLIGFIRILFNLTYPNYVINLLGILFLVGIAAIIFSIIGLIQINSNTEKKKGRGSAIFGLTFGLLAIFFFLFALWLDYMLSHGP